MSSELNAIKPVPNRQWSSVYARSCYYGCLEHSVNAQMWSNLGKWVLWFMSGSSLTRRRRQKDRCQASVSGEEWLRLSCLSKLCSEEHGTGGRVLPQSARDEALWPSRPPELTGPQLAAWDSSRTPISCARLSASSWRQSAPTWRCVSRPPACSVVTEGCMLGVYTRMSADDKASPRPWRVSVSPMKLALILNIWFLPCLGRHAYSYSNSLMEIADWLTLKGDNGEY